jgi:2,3-bisphosphoglycerate-dependent phosphoglycerate mutase
LNTATLTKGASSAANDYAQAIGTFENLFRLTATDTAELIFVRHAEPDYTTAITDFKGAPDPALTERGRRQAARLARRLREQDVDAIYTSPMRRAIETAAIIAAEKGLPIISTQNLREIEVSPRVVSNVPADEHQDPASQVLARFLENPRWDSIEGMEPSRAFRRRVTETVDAIVSRRAGQRVVLVTHAGVINAYVSTALDIERDMFFLPEHASVTVVRALKEVRAVQNLNDFAHLLPTFAPR